MTQTLNTVFELCHVYEKACGCDAVKSLGVFSTYQKAEEVRERVKDQPGFVDYPNGFLIDTITIDRAEWEEGFIWVPIE